MSVAAPQPKPSEAGLRPHEVEHARKLELLKKVKMIREGTMMVRGEILKGDTSKEYCWVNIREDRQIAYQAEGWEKVVVDMEKPPDQRTVITHWKPQADGSITRGDSILYQIDKEMNEAIQVYNLVRGLELTENKDVNFEEMLERWGVPKYKPKV